MDRLRVFVSSTCYDLKPIRKDLEDFISSMAFQPILSDSPSISIPPGLDSIEACKWLVLSSDIFVLIIGGRYGSIDKETGKSITSIEYDTAFEAGMPIYIFIDNEVLTQEAVYYKLTEMVQRNELSEDKIKSALGNKIEDVRVFDFIDRIRNASRDQWMHNFNNHTEIIDRLKNNWSLLFKTLLSDTKGAIGFNAILRVIPKPILRFIDDKGNPIDNIKIPSLPKLDLKKMVDNLESLRPKKEDLKLITDNIADIKKVLKELPPSELGISAKPSNLETFIESAHVASKYMDSLIDFIKNRPDHVKLNLNLSKRAIKARFDILNDGTSPAENIIVYLYPAENVYFATEENLSEREIIIPEKISKQAEELLSVAHNIAKLVQKLTTLSVIPKETIAAFQDIVTKIGGTSFGSNIFGSASLLNEYPYSIYGSGLASPSLTSSPAKYVTLDDETIRIDLDGSLKHNFHRVIKSEDIYIYCGLEKGKKAELNYGCHADNLPSPTKGKLTIIAE